MVPRGARNCRRYNLRRPLQDLALTPIRYTVTPADPRAHLFTVRCVVDSPTAGGQVFRLVGSDEDLSKYEGSA